MSASIVRTASGRNSSSKANPATGCPFWLEWASQPGNDPQAIGGFDDLVEAFDNFDGDRLREAAVNLIRRQGPDVLVRARDLRGAVIVAEGAVEG